MLFLEIIKRDGVNEPQTCNYLPVIVSEKNYDIKSTHLAKVVVFVGIVHPSES